MMTGWQGVSMGNRLFPQRNHPFRPGNEGGKTRTVNGTIANQTR